MTLICICALFLYRTNKVIIFSFSLFCYIDCFFDRRRYFGKFLLIIKKKRNFNLKISYRIFLPLKILFNSMGFWLFLWNKVPQQLHTENLWCQPFQTHSQFCSDHKSPLHIYCLQSTSILVCLPLTMIFITSTFLSFYHSEMGHYTYVTRLSLILPILLTN